MIVKHLIKTNQIHGDVFFRINMIKEAKYISGIFFVLTDTVHTFKAESNITCRWLASSEHSIRT